MAAVVVVLCALLAQFHAVNPIEVAIYTEIAKLPGGSRPVWVGLTWVGSWAGVTAAVAVALYAKRIRLGIKIAAGGALSWGLVVLMHWLLGNRPAPSQLLSDPVLHPPDGFAFPALPVALAAVLSAVAAPYLARSTRNLAWVITALVGLADVYTGGHLPLDAFAGGFLGWGVGTLFHLIWGAPGRKTSDEAIRRALDLAGLAPTTIRPVAQRLLGPREFAVDTDDGSRLRVAVVARLHRRAGLSYKLRRLLASFEVEDEPRLSTTHHEVEHEAFVAMLAERAGIRTPPVVLACEIEHGSPLLVRREVTGTRLSRLSASEITDELLAEIWAHILVLSTARIAHHDLRTTNILIDPHGRPWLLNFTFGRAGADLCHSAQDIAEALVSVATVVGAARAVRTARLALPVDRLEAVLPYLQPFALPRRIRAQAKQSRYLLGDLRQLLAEQIDKPVPGFRSPVRASSVVGMLLIGGAVYLLLPQLSGMSRVLQSLREANWWWLGAAVATGFIAIVMSSISFLGSSPRKLPFWRTTAVQLAAAFTGRTTPGGAGFFGINIAFLEKLGIRRSRAVGVTVLNLAATGFVAAVLCVVGVFGVGAHVVHNISVPTGWPVLSAIVGVAVLLGALIGSPLGRRRVVRPGLQISKELLCTLHHPLRATQLFGASLAYQLFSAFGLAASLAAFQPHFPLVAVLTVFIIGQTLGHLVPAPGGLGAVEALTIAGMTAVGIAPTAAIASVLASRLLTYWLPVLPGIAMFRFLQHHEII
ncbi:MAG: lysylphosphatidylglycerol synthase domain-containing protein [Sciscionella sp.]